MHMCSTLYACASTCVNVDLDISHLALQIVTSSVQRVGWRNQLGNTWPSSPLPPQNVNVDPRGALTDMIPAMEKINHTEP